MSQLVSLTVVAETLRIAVPYACAAVGGVWAERSGVVQIGLEGVMLVSAFGGVATAQVTGSPLLGVIGGVVAGVLLSLAHGALVVRGRVDAMLSGIALNLFAYAATRLALRGLYDSSSNSPSIEGFHLGPQGTTGWDLLGRFFADPITLLGLCAIAATPWVLMRTRLGLRVRAAGESPEATAAAGISVPRVRYAALAISGAVVAIGGVHLSFDQHRFESGMTAGRGFIALAAVVLSGWRPARAALVCLAFEALEALQIVLQDEVRTSPSGNLVQLLPYVATLVVLAFAAGRGAAPKGLGRHPET